MVNEYNLLDEPWIEVTMIDGSTEKMGIVGVFKNAHRIRCISGDSSSQDVAIMRILLAVLYAVYAGDDDYYDMGDGDAVRLWKSLYDKGSFNSSEISEYLERYRGRFFLFGDCPFYQAPITVGTEYSLMKLIGNVSESENKPRLFKSVSSRLLQGIGFDEAARWLVYVNAFDDTSAKPKVKGTPSPGAGWLGKIGIVFAQGDTLFETLMLNFVLLNNSGEPFDIDERPVWEKEPCYDERVEVPKPRNPMRLFTIQSRRILLTRSDNQAVGYILLGGDVFEKNDVVAETMTMWRCDDKSGSLTPRRHVEGRALWRDFGTMVTGGITSAGVVRWASVLKRFNAYPRKFSTFKASGLHFADKDFFVDGCFEDTVRFNASMLNPAFENWSDRVVSAISVTDECVSALGFFVRNVLVCEGYDPKQDASILSKRSSAVKNGAYSKIDSPFREWLFGLDPDADNIDVRMEEWYSVMRKIVVREGDRFLYEVGERALVGKSKEDNAVSKYRLFVNMVNKTIRG